MSTRVGSAHIDIGVDASDVTDSLVRAMDRALASVSRSAEQSFGRIEASAGSLGDEMGAAGAAGAERLDRALRDIDGSGLDRLGDRARQAGDDARRAGAGFDEFGNDVSDATREAGAGLDEVSSGSGRLSGALDGLKGSAAGLAGTMAGAFGAGVLLAEGLNVENQIANVNSQLGLTGAAAAMMGAEVKAVMRGGVADSAEEAAGAVGALSSQFRYLGFEGEQTAAELSDNFLAFAKTFDMDIAEATQTAGQLIANGLAPDVEAAADLMTTAMQRVPAAMRGELPEIINEYGTNFASLGFSGQQAFDLLVSASEGGKIALDKTGDALKEFGIRATDLGDTGAVEALASLGLAGEDIQARLLAGGDTARGAFQQVTDALVGVTDPAAQATAAVALFGTPLEDLDKTKLPAFLESLSATGEGMAGLEGSSQALADSFANSLDGRLNTVKGTVSALAGDAFMWLWDVLQNKIVPTVTTFVDRVSAMVTWVTDSEVAMTILAGAIAGVSVALLPLLARLVFTGIVATISGIATAFTAVRTAVLAANAALLANPFIAIAAAVVALVAGLAYFFTQTETGKRIWASLMDTLRGAMDWLSGAFLSVWGSISDAASAAFTWIGEAWGTIWSFMQSAWEAVGAPIFTAVKVGFAIILTAALLLWEGIQMYWTFIGNIIVWAWDTLIKPAWDAMQVALGALGAFFSWVWTGVIQPVWNALGAGIRWVYDTVIYPAWEALKLALGAVGAFFQWVWTGIIQPTWNALGAGINWVWMTVIGPTWDALKAALGAVGDFFRWVWDAVISPAWNALGNGIRWVLDTVVHPAFEGLKTGLGFVRDAFSTAVDFIGQMWDRIKGIAAAPVRFVIEEVYNNGIREVWNKVAGWLGLDELGKMEMPGGLEGYASGGVLPGYTPGRDVHKFVNPATGQGLHLSGGEAIMRPEWTQAIGGPAEVDRMNRAAINGTLKFAEGGTLPGWEKLTSPIQFAMARAVGKAFPGQQITSGTRYEDVGSGYDFHMAQKAVDFAPSQALANWIASEYGANVLELYWDAGPNIDTGMPVGAIGGHTNHVHWAMDSIIDPYTGAVISSDVPEGGAGGGGMSMVSAMVGQAFSSILDPIVSAMPDFGGGLWGGMPKALIGKLVDGAKEHLGSLAGVFGGGGGGTPLDLSGVAGDNLAIGQAAADMVGWKGHEWDMLKELWTRESQWNNNAQNPTSTAYGIAQFLDATWAGFGPKTSDPKKQIEYGVRYIQQRYGTPSAAVAFHDANNWYDQGGIAEGVGLMAKGTLDPERVLSPRQTEAFEGWMNAGSRLEDINKLIDALMYRPDPATLPVVKPEKVLNEGQEKAWTEWNAQGSKIDAVHDLAARMHGLQLDTPEAMGEEIAARFQQWMKDAPEGGGDIRHLVAALESGVEWERVTAGMQRSAEAWANGQWVQVAEDKRLGTPQEMLSQVGENFFAELAGEAGAMVGVNNPYTARKIVDETGTVQLALPDNASEIVPVTGDAPTVKADSGTGSIPVEATGGAAAEGTKETINVQVEVNVNGVQDPMAVKDLVLGDLGRGLETAIGTARST